MVDAIVVGGGHNGLTTAAYLARAGLAVCVFERRPILGGACVTEEIWPGRRISRASYVVSMLQPKVVADLGLREHGYEPIPLDPLRDHRPGRPADLLLRRRGSHARVDRSPLAPRRPALPRLRGAARAHGRFLRPLLLRPPPALGSRRPRDLLSQLREAGRAAGVARRDLLELYRVMTMSVGTCSTSGSNRTR